MKWIEEHWIFALVLLISFAFILPFILSDTDVPHIQDKITGAATLPAGEGCCLTTCTVTGESECGSPTNFVNGQDCTVQAQCNIGCCVDTEGYCYTNYLQRSCDAEGGKFLQGRECFVERQCLIPPLRPAEQEGYMFSGAEGVLTIHTSPSTVKYGESVVLMAELFEHEIDVRIEVSNNDTGYRQIYAARDNGIDPDRFSIDRRYSFRWDSDDDPVPAADFRTYELQAYIGGVKRGDPGSVVVTPGDCRPLQVSDTGTTNVLLTKRQGLDVDFGFEMQKIVEMFKPDRPKSEILNFYVYDQDIHVTGGNINSICPFNFEANDLVMQYDFDYPTCTQEASNIVHTNPDYEIVRRVNDSSFTTHFCDYIETKRDLVQRLRLRNVTPQIELINPTGNTHFDTPLIDLAFKVDDNPGDIRYKVYLDQDFNEINWGYTVAGNNVVAQIPIEDGDRHITIEAEDLDRNVEFIHFNYTANIDNFTSQLRKLSSDTFELKIDHNNETLFEYYVYNEETPIATGIYQKGTDEFINVTLPEGNHTLWVRSEERTGRRSTTDPTDHNISSTPAGFRTHSLITGAAVTNPPATPDPNAIVVTRADDGSPSYIGEVLDDGGVVGRDGFIYYPIVDDSTLYNPVKLCGLSGIDTGARYYPVECLASNTITSIQMQARTKTFGNGTFFYDHSYDVVACAEDIFIDVYLYQSITEDYLTLESEVLALGGGVRDDRVKESAGDYDQLCVMVSDDLVSNLPWCQTFGVPVCKDNIDNDGDGVCDIDGCFNSTGAYLPPDPGCSGANDFSEDPETTQCQDGLDNDLDGDIDKNDTGCIDTLGNYVPQFNDESIDGPKQCQDGLDNDGDGVVDLEDPGCTTSTDDFEGDGTTQCQDGNDNDADGDVDMDDPGCFAPTDNDERHESHDWSLFNDVRFDVQMSVFPVTTAETRYEYEYKATICDPGHGSYGLYDMYLRDGFGAITYLDSDSGLIGFNETIEGSGEALLSPGSQQLCFATASYEKCK